MNCTEEIIRLEGDFARHKERMAREIDDIKKELRMQSQQRAEYNTMMNGKIDSLTEWFKDYTNKMTEFEKTMVVVKELSIVLKAVVSKTENHEDFIHKLKRYWLRIALVGAGVGLTLSGLYGVYEYLDSSGIVIVFERIPQ